MLAKIAERALDKTRRLFAVIYLNGKQYKVSEGDIINVEHNVPLQLSDRIKLEKVCFCLFLSLSSSKAADYRFLLLAAPISRFLADRCSINS